MKTAVVILNWNGKHLLEKFLPSVKRFSSEEADIYVVDNASTDDSVAFVSSEFSDVKIIRHKNNLGYAGGYNEAFSQIDADIFVLLNSDVEVTENWLTPVIGHLELHPDVVAAQPKILDYNKKSHFEYAGAAGGFIDKYGYPYCRGRIFNTLEEDKGQYDGIAEIFWASGASLFVRADAYRQAGGLDTDYFAHQEEIDLCWRLKNNGFKIVCVGSSKVYHVGGASLDKSNPKKTYLNFRNSLFNLVKNAPLQNLMPLILWRLFYDGIAGFQILVSGKVKHFFSILKAHFYFYLMCKNMLQKRQVIDKKIKYYHRNSIIFLYFMRNRKYYSDL